MQSHAPILVDILDGASPLLSASIPSSPQQFARASDHTVTLMDADLAPIETYDFPRTRLLAVGEPTRLVLTRDSDLLIVRDNTVQVIGDAPCDSAAFIGKWVIATAPAADAHRILLIDPESAAVVDEVHVEAENSTAFITPHPTEPVVIFTIAMGQAGSAAYQVEVRGSALRVSEILRGEDPVIAGFSPSGTRLLVTPYPSSPEFARVLSWPGLAEMGRVAAAELSAEQGFGTAGCWIDDDRVALYATEDALIVADAALGSPARVSIPIDLRETGDIESLSRLRPGRVAVGLWEPSGRSVLVLDF